MRHEDVVATKTSKSSKPKSAKPAKKSAARRGSDDHDEDASQRDAEAEDEAEEAELASLPKKIAAKEAESQLMVPARQLTPQAKANLNELIKKGVPFQEALRQAGTWETFVAPVREEPAKLVPGGRPFGERGPRPPRGMKRVRSNDGDEDEPVGEIEADD